MKKENDPFEMFYLPMLYLSTTATIVYECVFQINCGHQSCERWPALRTLYSYNLCELQALNC